ncbi:unnamed protein product [Blepharisma stoltei]|uniref:Uncharacterized protein n=1 Tax=Blepharisma stoltei TaxID=1481888 RepID=A0AAU9JXQ6_9CILI|nr:unnamed protein product [Blepharisma stoltei]
MTDCSNHISSNKAAFAPFRGQDFGSRPRLISLESSDTNAYNICGSSSSESPGLLKDIKTENFIRGNRQRTYSSYSNFNY